MTRRHVTDSADIIIIGGGIAGLTSALELAGRKAGSIVLLEQEAGPGRQGGGAARAGGLPAGEGGCPWGTFPGRAFVLAAPGPT